MPSGKPKTTSAKSGRSSPINWKNHFVELLVVIIGILVAFMINRTYENYKDQQIAIKYLESFAQSLDKDRTRIKDVLEYNQDTAVSIEQLIQMIQTQKIIDDSAIIILSRMSSMLSFNPDLSAYDAIKFSGNLNLIESYALKEKLISYYQGIEANAAQYKIFELHVNNYFIPYLYQNMDILKGKILNRNSLRTPEFSNLVSGYLVLLRQNISNYERVQTDCEELSDLVTEYLNTLTE